MSVVRRLYEHVRRYRGWAVIAMISIALVSGTQLAMIAMIQFTPCMRFSPVSQPAHVRGDGKGTTGSLAGSGQPLTP